MPNCVSLDWTTYDITYAFIVNVSFSSTFTIGSFLILIQSLSKSKLTLLVMITRCGKVPKRSAVSFSFGSKKTPRSILLITSTVMVIRFPSFMILSPEANPSFLCRYTNSIKFVDGSFCESYDGSVRRQIKLPHLGYTRNSSRGFNISKRSMSRWDIANPHDDGCGAETNKISDGFESKACIGARNYVGTPRYNSGVMRSGRLWGWVGIAAVMLSRNDAQ